MSKNRSGLRPDHLFGFMGFPWNVELKNGYVLPAWRPRDGGPAFRKLVGLTGLEPVTLRLSSACSNQLSYRPFCKRPWVKEYRL